MNTEQQKTENSEQEAQTNSDCYDILDEKMDLSDLEALLKSLEESFQKVSSLNDPLKQEYEIFKEAKNLDIPLESYRRMFEAHQANRATNQVEISLVKPFKLVDKRLGDIVKWCENLSIYGLATVIGQLTLLVAMGSYFLEAPQRRQQSVSHAMEEIRKQEGREYSQSRITALETLNKLCEGLLGAKIEKAHLEGLKLNQCYQFKLEKNTFFQWPPQLFHYQGFDLSRSNLAGVNLKGANLKKVNLEGANLKGANLEYANLEGANLKGANLEGATLKGANLENANLEGADLDKSQMSRINLKGANLRKTSIIQGVLPWSNLEGAKLNQANLENANLNRANLQGTILYKTNLKDASMRYADLRLGSIMIGADLAGANLRRAKLWSADQLRRAYNWEQATKDEGWEAKINSPSDPYKIGYLIPNQSPINKLYQQGIEQAAKEHKNTEFIPVQIEDDPQSEKAAIQQLMAQGVDLILLRPRDPEKSIPALEEAYNSGVVSITIGDCLAPEGHKFVFGCYESSSYQMGYDLGQYMGDWAKKELPGKELNVGFVDGTDALRVFPYSEGFLAGLKDTKIPWKYIASTNAQTTNQADVEKVKKMLKEHPEIHVLWSSTGVTTQITLQAVKELELGQKINVFGIIPLTRSSAHQLLDSKEPLQSIVDQSPTTVGYESTLHAIQVLEGKVDKAYKYKLFPHRLFTQSDQKPVRKLLGSTLDLENNTLKAAQRVQN